MNILDNIMCQFWKSDLPPSDFAFVSDFVVVVLPFVGLINVLD